MKIKEVLDRDKVPGSMAQKIKDLRQERGMTLEEVANIVGVGKSTVRKWETGMIANMKRDKIAALAIALGTTPAYLMGWKEDKEDNIASPDQLVLTEGEKRLLESYRKLSSKSQKLLVESIDSLEDLSEEKQTLALQLLHFSLGNQ